MRLGLKLKKNQNPLKNNHKSNQHKSSNLILSSLILTHNNSLIIKIQNNLSQLSKNTKEQMIIQKDYIYIGEIQNNKMHGNGKIYMKQYDAYCNNNYFVYEGEFKNDQIDGKGTEYYGKTNNKKLMEFSQSCPQLKNLRIQFGWKRTDQITKFTIINVTIILYSRGQKYQQNVQDQIRSQANTSIILIAKPLVKQNDKWTKFDVELSKDHLSSLLSEKAINESVIEAYLNYINYMDSEKYFNLKLLPEIQAYKRTLIIPYFLFEQQKLDILTYFAEFSYLKGQFWQVYQKFLLLQIKMAIGFFQNCFLKVRIQK